MFLFSFSMDLSLFSFLNLEFPDFSEETSGTYNYIFSLLYVISMIYLIFYFFKLFFKTPNAITPNYENIDPESPSPKNKNNIDSASNKNLSEVNNDNNNNNNNTKNGVPKVGTLRRKTWWEWWKFSTMKNSNFSKEKTQGISKKHDTINTPRLENNDNYAENPLIAEKLHLKKVETIRIHQISENKRKYKILYKKKYKVLKCW